MIAAPPPAALHQMTRTRRRTEWRGNCTNTLITELTANDSGLSMRMPPSELSPPPPRRFAVPRFDGLWRGMTREEAARVHPMRPALTSAGKSRLVWIYDRPGEYSGELTFGVNRPDAKLERIDIHFGANEAGDLR